MRTFVGTALAVTLLLVPGASRAQRTRRPVPPPRAVADAPPAAGADPRADPRVAAVDDFLRAQMRARGIPGLQVAVVRRGRVALLRSYGTASVELGVPVTDTTVFAVNSVTKAFTGVAAMRLVEAGRLDLAAPVGRYLDGLPAAWRGVTVRQLLSHTSGLPDVLGAPTVETDDAAAWAWVTAQPVRFAPGARFDYCQTNYTLVQRVVNRLTGAAPDAPLARDQFAAAGMAHTRYGDAADVVPGKAPSYRYTYATPVPNGVLPPGVLHPVTERFLPFRRAASGLNSTAADVARWLVALRDGRLLGPAARETMWTPVAFTDGRVGQWGLGWQVLRRGAGRAVGMTGGGRAAFYVYPEHDVAVVLFTNLAGAYPEDVIDKVAVLYAPGLALAGVPALRIALEERGYERGYRHAATVAAELTRRDPALRWEEAELNDWGYRLLAGGRPREALEVLKLTAALFPRSANAYDSVAEAYAATGDRAAAVAHYRRSLALDPGNANAAQQLRRLAPAAPAAPGP